MSKKVTINGKEFQVYDGKGEPQQGDVALLILPLARYEEIYDVKDKKTKMPTGEKATAIKYIDTGYASIPYPNSDGTLQVKVSISKAKTAKQAVNISAVV